MKLGRATRRLYDEDSFLSATDACVVQVGPDYVELDATVAFPEGGGQESDSGVLILASGVALRFSEAKKMYTHREAVEGAADVPAGGVIWHLIEPQDRPALASLTPGASVRVEIDRERRARLSLSHTASHVLFLAIGAHRPQALEAVIGCHIRPGAARFDFALAERFTPQELARIEATANELIGSDAEVRLTAHPRASHVRYWHCAGHVIPCGGTHVSRLGMVGPLAVSRRGLGAGKERVACTFPMAQVSGAVPYRSSVA